MTPVRLEPKIRLRKFREQLPDGPTGDSETQVVSVKCLMSLEAHRDQSSLLLFHKINCGAVCIEKDKYMTPAHSSNLPGHHIVPNFVDPRHTVIP